MFRQENNKIILEMSERDWDQVLLLLGIGIGYYTENRPETTEHYFKLMDRINEGNEKWIPYFKPQTQTKTENKNLGENSDETFQ